MQEYSIPVTRTKEGLVLDKFTVEHRDHTRAGFSTEERAIIYEMMKDATRRFNDLKNKRGYKFFTETPSYKSIQQHLRSGFFLGFWNDYTQLFGISDEEAIKRYCMKQPEIDEQGNKEQVEPDEPEL